MKLDTPNFFKCQNSKLDTPDFFKCPVLTLESNHGYKIFFSDNKRNQGYQIFIETYPNLDVASQMAHPNKDLLQDFRFF